MPARITEDHRLHRFEAQDGSGVAAGIGAGDDQDLGGYHAFTGAFCEGAVVGGVGGCDVLVTLDEVGDGDFI